MASSPIGASTEQKWSSSELKGGEQSTTVEQRLDRLEKAALWIKEFLISTAPAPVNGGNIFSGFVTPPVGFMVTPETPDDEERTLPLDIIVEQPVKKTTPDTVDRLVSVLPLPNPQVPVALGKGEALERLVTKEMVIQPLGNIIEQLVCDGYQNKHVDVDSVTSETVVYNVSKSTEIETDGRRSRVTDRNYKFRKRKIWRADRFSSTKSKRVLGVRTIGRKQGYDWLRRCGKKDAALATCLVNYGMHFRSLSSEKNIYRFQFILYALGRGILPQEKRAQIMGTPLNLDKFNGKCGFGIGLLNPLNHDIHDRVMMVEVQSDSKTRNIFINNSRDSERDDLYPKEDGCRKPPRHGLSTEVVYSTSLSRIDLVWEPGDLGKWAEKYSYHGDLLKLILKLHRTCVLHETLAENLCIEDWSPGSDQVLTITFQLEMAAAGVRVGLFVSECIANMTVKEIKKSQLHLFSVGTNTTTLARKGCRLMTAALSFGISYMEGLIPVFDPGGGTLYISVLVNSTGGFAVKTNDGYTFLGGNNLDKALLEFLVNEVRTSEGIDLAKDRIAGQRLREAIEKTIDISSTSQIEITMSSTSVDFPEKPWDAFTWDVLYSFEQEHIVRACAFSEGTKQKRNLATWTSSLHSLILLVSFLMYGVFHFLRPPEQLGSKMEDSRSSEQALTQTDGLPIFQP